MAEGGRGGLAAAGVVAVFVAPIFLVLGLAVIGSSDADAANVCVAQPAPSPSTSSTAVADETCSTSQVSLSGWAHPSIPTASVTSSFSPSRFHPTLHIWRAHLGTDYSAGSCGEAIYAAHDGTVTFAGMSGNLGMVSIDHGSGVRTSYLHMTRAGIFVNVGDDVAAGQQIAVSGSTGNSTGCHLHFEVWVGDKAIDPVPFLAGRLDGDPA